MEEDEERDNECSDCGCGFGCGCFCILAELAITVGFIALGILILKYAWQFFIYVWSM